MNAEAGLADREGPRPRLTIRSPWAWLAALWIGAMIHVDWHLGRPGHGRLSFGLPLHWILGVAAFAPVAWLVARRCPASFLGASALVILAGVALGQIFEPLGEVAFFRAPWEALVNPTRWRVFSEFLAAGLLAYAAAGWLAARRAPG